MHLRVGVVVGQSEQTESPGISGLPNRQVQHSPCARFGLEMVEESGDRRLPMYPEGSSLQMTEESWIARMEE